MSVVGYGTLREQAQAWPSLFQSNLNEKDKLLCHLMLGYFSLNSTGTSHPFGHWNFFF